MMKKLTLAVVALLAVTSSSVALAGGASHAEHRGQGGNGGKYNNEKTCKDARIGKITPAALSEVSPGSGFSFMIFEAANNFKKVEVTAKKLAVPVTLEHKGDIIVVNGTLPAELKAMPVRINVKVIGKGAKCTTDEGWLLKITE